MTLMVILSLQITPKVLAEKINYIINNPEVEESMSKQSIIKIKDYSIEEMVKAHLDIFEELTT